MLRDSGGNARQSGVAHTCQSVTRVLIRRRTGEVVPESTKVWWIEMLSNIEKKTLNEFRTAG